MRLMNCSASGQITAAVLIAGTVLEYVDRSPGAGSLTAHGTAGALSLQQARRLVTGVRQLVMNGHGSRKEARGSGLRGPQMNVVLDASAVIAFSRGEPGAEVVERHFECDVTLNVHSLNLWEVCRQA